MSVIGLDWGQRFVGFASADPQGIIISPRGFFERKSTKENTWKLSKNDVAELKKINGEWENEIFILGLPLNADGSESAASQSARLLGVEIATQLKIPVKLIDERLTSWEAKGKNNHAEAAALILKNYFLTGSSA